MPIAPVRDRPAPAGRRLEGGIKPSVSKYVGRNPNAAREEALRLGELEKSRARLGQLIESYAKLLVDTTVPDNRTTQAKEEQRLILDAIPRAAADLDTKNIGEGTQSVMITLLSSVFVMRDQINKLKHQNYFLNKKVQTLKDQIEAEGKPASLAEVEAASGPQELKNGIGE